MIDRFKSLQTYYYRIKATDNQDNESNYSANVSTRTPDASAPSAPKYVKAIATKGDPNAADSKVGKQITLTWLGSKDNSYVVGYKVFRSTEDLSIDQWQGLIDNHQEIKLITNTESGFTDLPKKEDNIFKTWVDNGTDLTQGHLSDATAYYYRIVSFDDSTTNEESYWNSPISAKTSTDPQTSLTLKSYDTTPDSTKPTTPQAVQVKNIHGDGIALLRNIITWQRIPESDSQNQRNTTVDFKEYQVYACNTYVNELDNDCTKVGTKTDLGENYFIHGVNQSDSDKNYYYYVIAIDNAGEQFKYQDNTLINPTISTIAMNNQSSHLTPVSINPGRAIPVVLDVNSSNVGVSSANITWVTNQDTDSLVEYREKNSNNVIAAGKDRTQPTANHSVILGALKKNTPYEYRVVSRNSLGNIDELAANTWKEFTTQDFSISGDSASTTTTTSTVTWNTNVRSDSQVEYKLEINPGEKAEVSQVAGSGSDEDKLVTSHSVMIKALTFSNCRRPYFNHLPLCYDQSSKTRQNLHLQDKVSN